MGGGAPGKKIFLERMKNQQQMVIISRNIPLREIMADQNCNVGLNSNTKTLHSIYH